MSGCVKKVMMVWMIVNQGFFLSCIHSLSMEISGQNYLHCFEGYITGAHNIETSRPGDRKKIDCYASIDFVEIGELNCHGPCHDGYQKSGSGLHSLLLVIEDSYNKEVDIPEFIPVTVIPFSFPLKKIIQCRLELESEHIDSALLQDFKPSENTLVLCSTDTSPPSATHI